MRERLATMLLLSLAVPCRLNAEQKQPIRREATTLSPLPAGLTLPVTLKQRLQAGRTATGTAIQAVTTQRILLPNGLYLKAGAHLLGSVLASTSTPPSLDLRFTTLQVHDQTVPISVRAIAIANFTDVSDTALPANSSTDRGNPSPANWTTRQIGGDEVVRSGWSGDVINNTTQTVGFANYDGVYASPPKPGDVPHAVGSFSTSAHGLYGKSPDCTLNSPVSIITIGCTNSRPELHSGDNLLLEILPTSSPSHD